MQGLTYKDAGVDIAAATVFKKKIKALVRTSFRKEVLRDIGGFGSYFAFEKTAGSRPVLVSSTDGVGTKLMIAQAAGKHDTVGIDLVGMNVNDILCVGAQPLFFLDYIASGTLQPRVLYEVVKGINAGCIQSGCALVGGETAEMPDMYKPGEYDLAGFCVGVVDRARIIDGSQIKPGDAVIGLASSGIHSNGYSLVRKVYTPAELKRRARTLLTPTRIYVKPVLGLLKKFNARRPAITGISHITGGAFYDKISRILPKGVDVRIAKGSWPVPAVFTEIQRKGGIADKEMYHTLNMGIGMVLIVRPSAARAVGSVCRALGLGGWQIGVAVKGRGEVSIA